jgi:hypothetical protein
MKNIVKSLSCAALAGVIGLCLSLPAKAQHRAGNGGGNSSPAPQRSAPQQSAPVRSFTPRTNSPAPQRSNNNNSFGGQRNNFNNNHQNTGAQRTNNGITQSRQFNGQRAPGFNGTTRVQSGASVQTYRPNPGAARGSYYGHNHVGFSGGVGARAGFVGHGNTYYHYNHGYYGSYYAPRLGFSLGVLPYGYYPFYYGDYQYFYSGGLFYQYDNDQYTVVEPPVGAEVKTLPSDAQSIVINGQQYYESNGVYYVPITKDDGTLSYQVAGKDGELNTADASVDNAPPAPQVGDIVTQLPSNCRKISVNGNKLYLSPDGIYYQAQVDQDGNKTYKIVGLPEDDNQNQPDQTSN